jgi:hypothetical protein
MIVLLAASAATAAAPAEPPAHYTAPVAKNANYWSAT